MWFCWIYGGSGITNFFYIFKNLENIIRKVTNVYRVVLIYTIFRFIMINLAKYSKVLFYFYKEIDMTIPYKRGGNCYAYSHCHLSPPDVGGV